MRRELGRYMFFCDVEGAADDPVVAEAIEGLRSKAESVRLLGSYPVARPGSRSRASALGAGSAGPV